MADVDDTRDAVTTQVLEQQRRLDALLDDLREAFRRSGTVQSLREAFSLLREALETHFEQEDRLYHPAIWSLRPTQKPALQACVRAHAGFRSTLRDIAELLEHGEMQRAAQTFDLLAQGFERHEAAEEVVLAELDREMDDAPVRDSFRRVLAFLDGHTARQPVNEPHPRR